MASWARLNWPLLLSLFIMTVLAGFLPLIFSYKVGSLGSETELIGRSWLFSSFVGSAILTFFVVIGMDSRSTFGIIKETTSYKIYYRFMLALLAVLTAIGFIACFEVESELTIVEYKIHVGLWAAKILAFIVAILILGADYCFLRSLRNLKKEKEPKEPEDVACYKIIIDEFDETVNFIDIPVVLAILVILLFAVTYQQFWNFGNLNIKESFVHGFSAGAVAVELYFANIVFWFLSRKARE